MAPAPAPSDTSCRRSRKASCASDRPGKPAIPSARIAARNTSANQADAGAGIIRRQNRAEALAGASPPDRSPLAHPDAMAVAAAAQNEPGEMSVSLGWGVDGKIRAAEN